MELNTPMQVWNDKREASKWLGLSEGEFRGECEKFPQLLPKTRIGKEDKWHALDLGVYAYLRSGKRIGAGDDEGEVAEKK